jgi:hypothetical protein
VAVEKRVRAPRSSETKGRLKVSLDRAAQLRVPSHSLPLYAYVSDLTSSRETLYDMHSLTYGLQETVVGYWSDLPLINTMAPEDEWETFWLVLLKARQAGSTNTNGLCTYVQTSYTPGHQAALAADRESRAEEMFRRIQYAHNRWPREIRTDRVSDNETRSYTTGIDSAISVFSMHSPDVGVGLAVDSFVGSEVPLWADARRQLSGLIPAMMNRRLSRLVLEATAQPMSAPSGEYWKELYIDGLEGDGRWRSAFFPFWDSKANRRTWPKGQVPTNDEIRLLERFGKTNEWGHPGLTLENLAFRRWSMATDPDLRRNPEMFNVWYPFDDQTCWVEQGLSVVPKHAIDRHLQKELWPEVGAYNEFPDMNGTVLYGPDGKPVYVVNPDAIYLVLADPTGYGTDHAAFHVFEVWADEWIQVASYGAQTDPNEFARLLFDTGEKFNRAWIAIERNGVGVAALSLLKHMGYKRIWHANDKKPGVHKANEEAWLEKLIDDLMGKLTLRGKRTALQVSNYRHDKMVAKTQRAEILRPDSSGGRRARGHWDKVSALMVGCQVAHLLPRRYKHVEPTPENVIPFDRMTWRQSVEYLEAARKAKNPPKRRLHWRRRAR